MMAPIRLRPATAAAAGLAFWLGLSACQAPLNPQQGLPVQALQQQRQPRSSVQVRFATAADLPDDLLARFSSAAQNYADEVSRRRQLDFFSVPPQPVGLQLQAEGQSAWLLSYLGTARTRNDLNVEIRLMGGQNQALSLNYSGPVTRNEVASTEHSEGPHARTSENPFHFELITGLPGEGITDAYGRHLSGLADYLRYRYQSRPVQFDDGPLIYAVHQRETLLGFAFVNSRNLLVLGERKYADVQSVVLVGTQRQILGSYTLVAFNPKTSPDTSVPDYRISTHPEWGNLIECGEW